MSAIDDLRFLITADTKPAMDALNKLAAPPLKRRWLKKRKHAPWAHRRV